VRSLQEDLGGLGASPAPPHALGWVQGSAALLAHDQPGLQSGSHPLSCCWAVAEFSFPHPHLPSFPFWLSLSSFCGFSTAPSPPEAPILHQ